MSGEIDFKPKLIRRDGEGCHTLIKGKVYPEDLAVLTIYAADTGAPKFAKLALVQLKSHIHPHAVRVVTSLSPTDGSSRQKLNRELLGLTDIANQMDLTDMYRTSHPNTKEYSFFSADHRRFSKTDHIRTKRASTGTGKLKQHPASDLTTWIKAGYYQQQKQSKANKLMGSQYHY